MVDVDVRMPDGSTKRVRRKSPVQTKRAAEQYERELKEKILAGEYGREPAPTMDAFADRFLREHATPYLKPRTLGLYTDLLDRYVRPRLGKQFVDAIDRKDVERLHQSIGREKPTTANRVLQLLSVLFSKAEHWGVRPQKTNPCVGVNRFEERPKERFLTPDERATLADVLEQTDAKGRGEPGYVSPGAVLAIRLLAATGARCSEITTLTWGMVDMDGARLNLPEHKTAGTAGVKRLPLSPQAVELLRAAKPKRVRPGDLVCPSETGTSLGNMERVWGTIRKRAGLDDVRLHDLRHSAASDALSAGVPLAVVGRILGHTSAKTTQRYAHVAEDVLKAAAATMGASIESRTRSGKAKKR